MNSTKGAWIVALAVLLAAGGLIAYFAHVRSEDQKAASHRQRIAEDAYVLQQYGQRALTIKKLVESQNDLELAKAKQEGRNAVLKDWLNEYNDQMAAERISNPSPPKTNIFRVPQAPSTGPVAR